MPSPRSKIDINRLAELREERGWSVARIAAELGISPGAVSWQCLRHGIEPRVGSSASRSYAPGRTYVRGGHQIRAFSAEEDALLQQMALDGASNSEIGRRLGRNPNSIMGRLMTLARREARSEEAA